MPDVKLVDRRRVSRAGARNPCLRTAGQGLIQGGRVGRAVLFDNRSADTFPKAFVGLSYVRGIGITVLVDAGFIRISCAAKPGSDCKGNNT